MLVNLGGWLIALIFLNSRIWLESLFYLSFKAGAQCINPAGLDPVDHPYVDQASLKTQRPLSLPLS